MYVQHIVGVGEHKQHNKHRLCLSFAGIVNGRPLSERVSVYAGIHDGAEVEKERAKPSKRGAIKRNDHTFNRVHEIILNRFAT